MKKIISIILAVVMVLSAVPLSCINGSGILSDVFGIESYALKLSTPVLVSAVNGVNGATVKWNGVFAATSYNVYRKTAKSNWAKIGNVEGTTYSDTKAVSGTTYTYTVRACRGSSISGYDTKGKTLSYIAAPKLSSVVNGVSGVTVKWAAVGGAASYNVYRRTEETSWKKIGTASSTSYSDKNVQSGTTYYYTVRGYKGSNISGYRDGKSIIYLSKPVLKSAANASGGITVSWNSVKGASGYNVYRKTTGSWARIGTSLTTSYTDKNVNQNTSYTYTVRALKGATMSGYDTKGVSAKAAKTVKKAADDRVIKLMIDETGGITTEGDKGILGFGYSASDKCFYATGNAWQRNFGYTKLYDAVSELVAISYDTFRVFFKYDYKDWMIQFWKGQYGFVLEGAEIGVYNKPSQSGLTTNFYNCASDKDRLPISLSLYNSGVRLFTRGTQTSWWMTGFVLGKLGLGAAVTSEFTKLLSVTASITLKDDKMCDAFVKGLQDVNSIVNNVDYALDIANSKLLKPGERAYSFKNGDGKTATVINGTYKVDDNTVTLSWK